MVLNNKLIGDWYDELISVSISNKYLNNIIPFLDKQYAFNDIYPAKKDVFKAFKLCQSKDLKVVILGQDPYFNGTATGLAFGNNNDVLRPNPSLIKINECVERTCYNNFKLETDYSLENWASQGVLLMNTALTVKKGQPGSHIKYWKRFTENIIKSINYNKSGIFFLLWGSHAKSFKPLINDKRHYVMEYTHPAYAARRGLDWKCPHFKEVNKIIKENNGESECITW